MTEALLTSVVGSHARPRWFVVGDRRRRARRVRARSTSPSCTTTPSMSRSATRRTPASTSSSDGEMRRAGFFTAEFYRHLTGVVPLPADRRLGAGGHDQQHRFEVIEPIAAPDGLGRRRRVPRTPRPARRGRSRSPSPGRTRCPAGCAPGPARSTAEREAAAEAFVPDPAGRARGPRRRRRHVHPDRRPVAGHPPRRPVRLRRPVQRGRRAGRRVGSGSARTCVSGTTWAGRWRGGPIGRSWTRCSRFRVDELVLEFANREMAEVDDRWARSPPPVATSRPALIDVKNYHLESADEVAERIDAVLAAGVPAERLTVVPDCGFSQTARWATDRQAPGAGRRSRPRARRRWPKEERTHGRPPDLDARHRAHRRLLHDDPARPARPRPGPGRVLAQRGARRGVPRALGHPGVARPTSRPRSSTPTPTSSSSALPNFLHEEAVGLAAKAGKAVLCTKPLGRTAEEATRMLDDGRGRRRLRRLPRGPVLHAQDAQGRRRGRGRARSAT